MRLPHLLPIFLPSFDFQLAVRQHTLHFSKKSLDLINAFYLLLANFLFNFSHNSNTLIDCSLGLVLQSSKLLLETFKVLVVRVRLVVLCLATLEYFEVKLVDSVDFGLENSNLLFHFINLQLLLVNDEVVLSFFAG
jgi:hypothetical protein